MLDYKYFNHASASLFTGNPVYEGDEFLSFTLPGWIAEQANGLATSMQTGMIMNFPEEQETVQENIREIAPHVLLYPSRLWEGVVSNIQVKISDAPWYKRLIYNICMPIGYKVADISIEGRKPNLFWRSLYGVAELIVFRPLRDKHGLIRTRVPYSAGAVLGPDILRFFRAIGLKLRQLYGVTEASVPTAHTEQEMKFESVGTPLLGVILRLSEEGEIMVEKSTCFRGYHKDAEATDKVIDKQGWYHTGDAGYIDEDGHLIYIDRMSDMRQLSDGTRFSPQYIESRLKFSPYIKDAFAVGGEERDFVGAIISIDFQNVGNWAEKKRIPYTTFVDLSQKPEVCELIRKEVQKVNRTLPERSRVKGAVNLHKEFDADEAELTRTRKLRRTFVEDRYKELAEAVYGEREELVVSAPVIYRDGRKGVVSTKIRVTHIE
jgi:long-chain acyl-CoA synthetase